MFKRAERKKAKLRLALCGPSGSGKTYSALQMALGMGGKIAFIDTEQGSGDMYDHLGEYDICQINSPFEVKKYLDAIHYAESHGYDTIIIDSLSHAWASEGGILDKVDKAAAASRSGNSFAAWRNVTPLHNSLVDTILQSSCHIIATMRSKTSYEIQDNNGKKTPVKVGLAPVQREGMDYEFTVVFDLTLERHLATTSKDRTGLFDNQVVLITPEIGQQVKTWLEAGVEPPKREPSAAPPQADTGHDPLEPSPTQASERQRKAFYAAVRGAVPDVAGKREKMLDLLSHVFSRPIESSKDLTPGEMSSIISDPMILRDCLAQMDAAPADSTPLTFETAGAIDKELDRIGGTGGELPPELAEKYGTRDASKLTEAQGREAVKHLKGY
jgi:RecA/RadA recombinase